MAREKKKRSLPRVGTPWRHRPEKLVELVVELFNVLCCHNVV